MVFARVEARSAPDLLRVKVNRKPPETYDIKLSPGSKVGRVFHDFSQILAPASSREEIEVCHHPPSRCARRNWSTVLLAKVPMLNPKLNIVNNLRMTQARLKSFLLIDPNDAFMLRGQFLRGTINDQFPQCKKHFTLNQYRTFFLFRAAFCVKKFVLRSSARISNQSKKIRSITNHH